MLCWVLSLYAAIISPAYLMVKFLVEEEKSRVVGVGVVRGDQQFLRRCYVAAIRTLKSHKQFREQRSREDEEVES